jgi:hypothetical protein
MGLFQTKKQKTAVIRHILLIIFLLGSFGTGAELLLVGHIEEVWQWIPLALLLMSILALFVHAFARPAGSIRIFQGMMILFITSGIIGIGLHYKARVEFKLEMNPEVGGTKLFLETIRGATVPPVLAPGMMIQLGLLGFAYTFAHKAMIADAENKEATIKEV